VEEHTLPEGTLTERVCSLLADPSACADMGERIRKRFACPDANERIYESLMGVIKSC
jgi:hypothetical protein